MYSSTLYLTSALDWDEWTTPHPVAVPLGQIRYHFYRRLVVPQSQSGWVRKISPTGMQSPDCSSHSKTLYQQCYP